MSLGQLIRPENRLEQLLQLWENKMQLVGAALTKSAIWNNDIVAGINRIGAVVNWRNFRKTLLSRKPYDPVTFGVPEYVTKKYLSNSPVYLYIPEIIHNWSQTSRRMYMPTKDMQISLELTQIGRLSWGDIHPPFPSFGMVLPIPIAWKHEARAMPEIDFVYAGFSQDKVLILTLGKDLDARPYLTEKRSAAIEAAVKSEDIVAIEEILNDLSAKHFGTPAIHLVIMERDDKHPIMEDLNGPCKTMTVANGKTTSVEEELPDYWKLIIRMVAGMCLHLETMSKDRVTKPRVKTGQWKKLDQQMCGPRMVTAESMVCSVDTTRVLSPEERQMHARIRSNGVHEAVQMSVHFRSACWRKKPGMGDDPLAPKCVYVDWSIVNMGELGKFGLPMASAVTVNA